MSHEEQLRLVEGLHARESGLLERTSLFDLLAPEVEWLVAGSPEVLPWAGVFRGPDGVTVIEIVLAGGRARATGSAFESEVVRIWTFRGNEAIRVRSFYDTGAYERAVLGS